MSRWRILVVASLILLPFLGLAGVGSYYLWMTGIGFYTWWILSASLALGYCLGWYWQRKQQLIGRPDFTPPKTWTDLDQQAWQLVEARAKAASQVTPNQLAEIDFYTGVAKDMALELARFYHPQAQDPTTYLTLTEILAVVELASHDLAEMVDQYLPGGHLLSIREWRLARQALDWYQTATQAYWLISALFAPIQTSARYAASKVGLSRPLQMLQDNLLLWFYTAFVHRVGAYLIDLNSGRLRVGAKRYREWLRSQAANGQTHSETDAVDQIRHVTVTLLGQVKAGKSSLVNALIGEQQAVTDVLPATEEVARYEVQPEGIPTRLVLLDTVGYAHTGPREDQVRATESAAQQSDLLLVVLHARNPARQADLQMLQKLHAWFKAHQELKKPPMLGVLTHVDLLSPMMEWAPPYDWERPRRLKEQQVDQAIAVVHQQLGEFLVGVAPVCTAEGKVYGIDEYLLPAVSELLDEVHAVALLRCLHAEIDTAKVRKVFYQFLAAGKQMAKIVWRSLATPSAGGPDHPRP